MRSQGQLAILANILSVLVFLFVNILPDNYASAFDFYVYDYLRSSKSPVARGMGGCEINLVNEYSASSNPASLGLLHQNKRVSISFPGRYKWDSESSPEIEQKSHSISIGLPLTVRGEHFGLGISYSDIESDSYWRNIVNFNIISYIEKTDCFSLGVAYYNKVRIGIGYTWKRIDSRLTFRYRPDYSYNGDKYIDHDIGLYLDYPLRNSESLDKFLSEIDKDNVKHNIIPSIAYVRSNIGGDFRYEFLQFENRALPKTNKIGFSTLFISNYKDAEIFTFRISYEFNDIREGDDINFNKAGIEVGAGGTLYMRAGFWSTSTIDQKIWTYGFGVNLGGLANILYATGKIKTANPVAQYILKNISISADYAMERSNDESEYEDSDYFKICFSI